ncbi:sugar nucleotide-binding protein [Chryseobacterium sp. DT-3]|uniref:sugar nucleotide-binding protein n=1 Tax=Chryseobacterium sp. DT-3 TaxID=3396164 RepID=UPI003F19980A
MKKMLIIGIKGMAGHLLFNYYDQNDLYDVYGIARNIDSSEKIFNLDVSDTAALKSIITNHKFDYVVNCIGILNKDAEDNPAKAIWFNSYFPHFLEEVTRSTATKIIHISTDCVFSGKDNGGYTEQSFKNGTGFYAQSKALGELDNDKDLTIRTSIIGPEINKNGIGLFHWFMTQPNEATLKGFSNVFWSGITTLELAKVVDDAIKNNVTGLKQIAREKIDKYNLILLFNRIFRDSAITIESNGDYHSDKSLISIRSDYTYNVPAYETMLDDIKVWLKNHPNNYNY